MTALRAGIAGYGLAGEVFHAPLVDAVEGLVVAGIVTGDAGRQARARAAFPDAAVVATVDELWGGIDLLVVAAANRAHVPLALAAVEQGVPVVVDKPLAATAADAERAIAAAEDAGVPLTVFQNRRFDGDFLTVRRLLAEGRLGEVSRFESRFERFRPEVEPGAWRESADVADGGGLLLDLGSHLVDQATELFGPPLRLYAEIETRRPGARADDDTFIALEHPGGVRSHLWMSAAAPLHGPRFAVSGARAGFAVDGLDPQEAQLADGLRPGEESYGIAPDGAIATAAGRENLPLERGAYERFYELVVTWLSHDGPAPVDPRDSLACLRLLDAARRGAETHSVIELEDSQ